MFSVFKWCR